MKVYLFIFILSIFIPEYVSSQPDSALFDPDQIDIIQPESSSSNKNSSLKDRLSTDIEVGTSFTYSPKNFYGPSYYISPGISYRMSPRFYISSGIGLQYSTFYPLYQQNEMSQKILPMTQAYIYARGTYLISPRLAVSGSVYKSLVNAPRLTENSRAMNYNYQGMSVGFNYKVTDSFSFGIQMNMQNGSYSPDGMIPASGYVPVPGF
jgi:hypothetical protein